MLGMKAFLIKLTALVFVVICLGGSIGTAAAEIDLSHAVIVVPDGLSGPENKAVRLLVEEVQKRSRIEWNVLIRWPTGVVPVVVIGPVRLLESFPTHLRQHIQPMAVGKEHEGFRIRTVDDGGGAPMVLLIGNDARGVLFGVGRLFRELQTKAGGVSLLDRLDLDSSPRYPLRGHQLGYRPKTNSYDAWDLEKWERYIRELAVFGTNAVELIPPRSDDAADSPHFPLPPLEMMVGMSRICADYGLDVWIWYPAMDADYTDPRTVEHALRNGRSVSKTAADRRGLRAGRRPGAHAAQGAPGATGKAVR